MTPTTPAAMARTRQILEDLEAVRENLLALSDDIWLSIDHNNPQALDAGVEFKRAYNAKSADFDVIANELSELVQRYTSIRLEEAEESGGTDQDQNDRIIAELNREEPHRLSENFTYKRPHGFILHEKGTTGITTRKRLYQLVMQQLAERDLARLRSLCDHPDFTTTHGNTTFNSDPGRLREVLQLGDQLYAESHFSANGIRDVIKRVLKAFEIPQDELQIFLRQDRDAGRLVDEP